PAPGRRRIAAGFLRPVPGDAVEDERIGAGVALVLLDDHGLGLARAVADLGHLDHRFVAPTRVDVGCDDPGDRIARGARPGQLAHDVPAVVHVAAAIDQVQATAAAFDLQPLQL